jgi:hypothetical protein
MHFACGAAMKRTALERFARHYIPEPNSGCWIWMGALSLDGYALFYNNGCVKGSIFSWELHRGSRNGFHVLHNCDNRTCVNPDHLHLGTNADNVKEREQRKKRAPPQGSKNGFAILSENDVIAMRADKRPTPIIAKEYGIHRSRVWAIKNRRGWKHVP